MLGQGCQKIFFLASVPRHVTPASLVCLERVANSIRRREVRIAPIVDFLCDLARLPKESAIPAPEPPGLGSRPARFAQVYATQAAETSRFETRSFEIRRFETRRLSAGRTAFPSRLPKDAGPRKSSPCGCAGQKENPSTRPPKGSLFIKVEPKGLEPSTLGLQSRCSPS